MATPRKSIGVCVLVTKIAQSKVSLGWEFQDHGQGRLRQAEVGCVTAASAAPGPGQSASKYSRQLPLAVAVMLASSPRGFLSAVLVDGLADSRTSVPCFFQVQTILNSFHKIKRLNTLSLVAHIVLCFIRLGRCFALALLWVGSWRAFMVCMEGIHPGFGKELLQQEIRPCFALSSGWVLSV